MTPKRNLGESCLAGFPQVRAVCRVALDLARCWPNFASLAFFGSMLTMLCFHNLHVPIFWLLALFLALLGHSSPHPASILIDCGGMRAWLEKLDILHKPAEYITLRLFSHMLCIPSVTKHHPLAAEKYTTKADHPQQENESHPQQGNESHP